MIYLKYQMFHWQENDNLNVKDATYQCPMNLNVTLWQQHLCFGKFRMKSI